MYLILLHRTHIPDKVLRVVHIHHIFILQGFLEFTYLYVCTYILFTLGFCSVDSGKKDLLIHQITKLTQSRQDQMDPHRPKIQKEHILPFNFNNFLNTLARHGSEIGFFWFLFIFLLLFRWAPAAPLVYLFITPIPPQDLRKILRKILVSLITMALATSSFLCGSNMKWKK
jgi:hypothetical protein